MNAESTAPAAPPAAPPVDRAAPRRRGARARRRRPGVGGSRVRDPADADSEVTAWTPIGTKRSADRNLLGYCWTEDSRLPTGLASHFLQWIGVGLRVFLPPCLRGFFSYAARAYRVVLRCHRTRRFTFRTTAALPLSSLTQSTRRCRQSSSPTLSRQSNMKFEWRTTPASRISPALRRLRQWERQLLLPVSRRRFLQAALRV